MPAINVDTQPLGSLAGAAFDATQERRWSRPASYLFMVAAASICWAVPLAFLYFLFF